MLKSKANSEMLSADGEMPLRLVTINRIPYWQSRSGRTFPLVAGAEDPPPADADKDKPKGDPPKKSDGGDEGDDFDKPRAMATITKLRESEKKLKDQLKELDTLKAKQKERDDAEKSEAEKLKEQLAEVQRKSEETARELQETRTRQAIERAAVKAGAADPDDIYRLLNQDSFVTDDSGQLTNADTLVKDLLKAKPYLAGKPNGTSGVPGTPRANGNVSPEQVLKADQEELRQSGRYNPL